MPKYFQISDGRIWSTDEARFVSSAPDGTEVVALCRAEGPADEACLRRSLESLGYKIGYELMASREEAAAAKLQEINAACDAALAALTAMYPERELLSFERQEREARALISGDTSNTAHIAAIASGRGIPVEDLAQKIVAKADAFSVASGTLIGQRQKWEDMLKAAQTKENVIAIQPVYSLPEAQS